jgi:hypothetical protein
VKVHRLVATLLLLLFLPLAMGGCVIIGPFWSNALAGNGVPKHETRQVGDFDKIVVDGCCNLKIICQEGIKLALDGDENLLPHIRTEVHGSRLHIFTDRKLSPRTGLSAAISMPTLVGLEINGSSTTVIGALDSKKLDVTVDGSGRIEASGRVTDLDVRIDGSGTLATTSLAAENVTVQISGSGRADIRAVKSIDVEISGSGNINYYGDPQVVHQSISGSGRITKR